MAQLVNSRDGIQIPGILGSEPLFPQPYTSQHLICELKIQDFYGHDPQTLTRRLTLGKGRYWAITGLCGYARQSTRLIHPGSVIKSSQLLCLVAIILPTLQIRKLRSREAKSPLQGHTAQQDTVASKVMGGGEKQEEEE